MHSPGDIINRRYQILSKIGEGKFGIVFQAKTIKTNQIVAIKTEDPGSPISLLKNETTILKYLYDQGCRHCPIVYWYGLHLEIRCLVFSFFKISLYDFLYTKPLDNEKKYHILRTCIEIIESIHTHLVIHRDIKPQNFMIRDGELFLIDFGLATFYVDADGKHIEDVITENLVGTPKYISYNVHCGHSASRRDDMMSLGYMFLFILNGELPFTGTPQSNLLSDNYPATHILHPTNFHLKDKKSWYMLENLVLKQKNIHKYLEHCYRLEYEGSPLYGELKKLFVDD
jgi:serine/threonine protein kinase